MKVRSRWELVAFDVAVGKVRRALQFWIQRAGLDGLLPFSFQNLGDVRRYFIEDMAFIVLLAKGF